MRIGFIGGDGHHYLRGLLNDAEAGQVVVAVAGDGVGHSGEDLHARMVKAYPSLATSYYASGDNLLDQFGPDLVSVGAVYGVNGDWNAHSLSRGLPTVSDKPIASTWGQLDRLRALAAADGSRVLLTEFNFRSRPEFRTAQECVRNGSIGQVVLASGQKSYRFGHRPAWYADRERFAGLVLWVASHAIDAVEFVTGQNFRRLVGRGGNVSRPDFGSMEDHVALVGELQGGASAVVHADFGRPRSAATHGDDRLRVVGSSGVVEVRDGVCRLTTADSPEREVLSAGEVLPMHRELMLAIQGRSTAYYSTAESLRSAAVLLHARDAVDRQEWVDIDDADEGLARRRSSRST